MNINDFRFNQFVFQGPQIEIDLNMNKTTFKFKLFVCEKKAALMFGNSHSCYNQEIISQQGYVQGFSFKKYLQKVLSSLNKNQSTRK